MTVGSTGFNFVVCCATWTIRKLVTKIHSFVTTYVVVRVCLASSFLANYTRNAMCWDDHRHRLWSDGLGPKISARCRGDEVFDSYSSSTQPLQHTANARRRRRVLYGQRWATTCENFHFNWKFKFSGFVNSRARLRPDELLLYAGPNSTTTTVLLRFRGVSVCVCSVRARCAGTFVARRWTCWSPSRHRHVQVLRLWRWWQRMRRNNTITLATNINHNEDVRYPIETTRSCWQFNSFICKRTCNDCIGTKGILPVWRQASHPFRLLREMHRLETIWKLLIPMQCCTKHHYYLYYYYYHYYYLRPTCESGIVQACRS